MNRRSLLGGLAMGFGVGKPAFAADASFVINDLPKPMPDLQFTDHNRNALTLKDFSGKIVLLNIWATWCAPCRKEMPALDRLQVALGGPNFVVLPVSIDRKGFATVDVSYVDTGIQHLTAYVASAANHAPDMISFLKSIITKQKETTP